MWAVFPQFIFLAEVYWSREVNAIISGLIPYASALPRAIASVYSKGLNKDGRYASLTPLSMLSYFPRIETRLGNCLVIVTDLDSVMDLGSKRTVRVFYDWYEMERRNYPQNAITIFPSSTHYVPYPTALYGATLSLREQLAEIYFQESTILRRTFVFRFLMFSLKIVVVCF